MPSSLFRVKYGLDVNGDIIITGNVDGVDVSAFKTDYDNHGHTFSEITNKNLADMDEKNYSSLVGKPTSLNNISTTEYSKLNGIENNADVTDSTNVNAAGAVMESDYNANTILVAVADNTPLPLIIGASTIVGRTGAGEIAALSAAEVRTIINVESGADVTDSSSVNAAGAVMETDFDAGTFLYASSDNTPTPQTAAQVRSILNVADGANAYIHPNHTGEVTSTNDGATVVSNNVIDANNLMGDSAALGDGINGYALVAGTVANRFAWHGFGAAADKGVVTSIDTSASLPTSNAVKTYVDNVISGLGNVLPPVADLTALKVLVVSTDMSDKDMILVESLGLYRYDEQATDTANDNTIIQPTAGGGRWFKISSTINEHANLDGIDKWGGISGNTYHVPNIDSNTAHFLRGDGTWATPPGTYTHPNHSGDVTSTGDGNTVIGNDKVTNAKLANMSNYTIKGRYTASTGDPEDLTATQVRTIINVADGANNYSHPTQSGISIDTANAEVLDILTVNTLGHVTAASKRTMTLANLGYTGATNANYYTHPNHSGDVTSVADGATTIVNGKITESKLQSVGGGTLSGGSSGKVLQWDTGGTFKWGTAADPVVVAYTYGDSNSFRSTSIGTSTTVINSFAKAASRSAEWLLSVNDIINSRYETLKIFVVHDGTNVYYNEFGNVSTSISPNVTFTVAVNGANIELSALGTSTNNTITGICNLIDT